MPLYKLFCIASHYPEYKHIKELVTQSAKLMLDNGSVVRKIQYIGPRQLPQRMKRHTHFATVGDYWTMHFDAPPALIAQLNERLQADKRVLRWTLLKLGERLSDVVDTNGGSHTVILNNTSVNLSLFDSDASIGQKPTGLEDETVASLGGAGYARERV